MALADDGAGGRRRAADNGAGRPPSPFPHSPSPIGVMDAEAPSDHPLDFSKMDHGHSALGDVKKHHELVRQDVRQVSFGCVKISAICPISVLERMSDLLRWEQRDPSFHLPWKKDTLPIFSNSSPLYHTTSMPDPLTPDEELDLTRESKERLVQATEAAERMGVSMGFKLVRGAYLTRESQLASSLGAASPIHSNIHDTHTCYNECGSFMLGKIAKGWGSIVLATHNIESGNYY